MPLYPPPARQAATTPADLGFAAWNFDPQGAAGTGSSPMTTQGQGNVQRLYLDHPATVANIYVYVQTAGATLTAGSCKSALFNAAGTLLSTSADQATAWTTTGLKPMLLGTAQNLAPGFYDVESWYNGTTGPAFIRGSSYAYVNGSLTGQALRSATANTGLTTAAPATLGTKTASLQNFWVALG